MGECVGADVRDYCSGSLLIAFPSWALNCFAATPEAYAAFKRMGGDFCSRDPRFTGHFWGSFAAFHATSLMACAITLSLDQASWSVGQFARVATVKIKRRNPALGEAQGFTYRPGEVWAGGSSYCRFVLITWIMPPLNFSSGMRQQKMQTRTSQLLGTPRI